jgi:hypothetical protein
MSKIEYTNAEKIEEIMKMLKELDPKDDEGRKNTMSKIKKTLGGCKRFEGNIEETLEEIANFAHRLETLGNWEPNQEIISKLINAKRESDKKHIKKGSIGVFHRINPDTDVEDYMRKLREKNNKKRKNR